MRYVLMYLMSVFLVSRASAQQVERRERAVFIERRREFYDSMKTTLDKFYEKKREPQKELIVDFSSFNPPKESAEFVTYWHNPPASQGISGMCWCFSTTSFFESEIYRLSKRVLKLSELYTVYWEYVEKAKGYVRARGNQEFGEGSECDAVIRVWKKYGIVPANAYTGIKHGQPFHDHRALFAELSTFLHSIKQTGTWNEELVEQTVRSILNEHLGEPPKMVVVDGASYTPKEYLEKVVRLNLDDYIQLTSFADRSYYEWTVFDVPDNWWFSRDYFNVPFSEFVSSIKRALRSGYTVVLGGDVSEPGIYGKAGIAVIPTFDIPPQYIDEYARIYRFRNGTTGDDHGVHCVGYTIRDGTEWYLIKDSGAGSRDNTHPGYFYFHEDYVKLKMLTVLVHKSAIPDIVTKIPKN
ncbi:MAG: C1 family peptidase [Bacteroidetes bacterium]|nr:C1 family peptidase [Bacteroidota bacterium]